MRLAGDPIAGAILHRAFGPTVHESCDEFLEILASLSDGSGAGDARRGPTELASDIRHADRTSREIHAVYWVSRNHPAGHGSAPPAKLSTPASDGGSA